MLEEAENLLSTTPRSLQSDEMRSQLTQLRAFMANINGDADSAIHISLDGEEQKGSINAALSDVNYLVGFQLGYAYYSKGELDMAEKIFRSVSKSAEAAEDIYNEVISEIELAGIYLLKGDLVKAEQQYMQTQEWLSQKVENTVMLDGIIKVCHAGICLERNQLEKAFQLVNEGIEDALLGSRTNTLAHGYAILAQVLRAKGDLPGAREAVDRAIAQIEKHRTYPRTVENVRTCQVDQWLSEGNLSAARQWAKEEFHSSCELPGFSEELKNISLGRVLLYSQEFQEAKELLEKLSLGAQEGGRESRLIKINTLQALALQGLGKTKEALFLLERTLAKACQKGFFRVFLDEGDPLVELLILGQKQGIWGKNGLDEYVNKMLVSSNRMD
jgi:LuxR family maltose regulon positive regulatory protein